MNAGGLRGQKSNKPIDNSYSLFGIVFNLCHTSHLLQEINQCVFMYIFKINLNMVPETALERS